MRDRSVARALALCAAVLMLGACGGGDSASNNNSPAGSTNPPSSPAPPAPAPLPTGVLFQDGFESGNLSFTQSGIRWGDSVRTSVNALNARSGTRSLQFTFPGVADGDDSFSEQRIELTNPYTEIWIRFDLHVPGNYVHRTQSGATNNKFFALYRNPYTAPGFHVNFSTAADGSGGSDLHIHYYDNGVERSVLSPAGGRGFLTSADHGQWHQIVLHVRVPTGQDTNDGVMQLWKNGVQLVNITNLDAWGGTGSNYFDAGYVLGWANSGFSQQTLFYVDNFVIATESLR